ncbi:hypothetical protein BIV57_10280 [Mangrovactinospora gilvigrisea]|uniref:HTH tetR-type domain-containing protein n=1 Tax=Mangrovactinospora gilvigrisea TaxID=1428644 RepID=A0A1J7C7S5_9ACTN|nr:TetR/AcrR family transcriptional regulator [Mangrovactinospora gilvigrisea]OIV37580.1 hypothetical protein BIV57_10280 [Mangrovactinospora gilvigrisea]
MPKTPPSTARRDSTEATREALLAAARTEFAAYGIAGARVDRIAKEAGVNKERIYGHFGSKEKLFDAVMGRVLEELAQILSKPDADVGAYVARVYDHHRQNPELLRLMLWESLHYGGARADDAIPEKRRAHYRAKLEHLAPQIGRSADDPEVGRMLITLCGLGLWPVAVPQMGRLLLGDRADDVDGMREHLVAAARAAFPEPESAPEPEGDPRVSRPSGTPATSGS